MLDREFVTRWIEALRSGKYEQSTGYLRDEHGYCCLGVAADLVDPDCWEKECGDSSMFWFDWGDEFTGGSMPRSVWKRLGLRGLDQGRLIGMNDNGHTFDQIADEIEKSCNLTTEHHNSVT